MRVWSLRPLGEPLLPLNDDDAGAINGGNILFSYNNIPHIE